jgi:hypothetical protein
MSTLKPVWLKLDGVSIKPTRSGSSFAVNIKDITSFCNQLKEQTPKPSWKDNPHEAERLFYISGKTGSFFIMVPETDDDQIPF